MGQMSAAPTENQVSKICGMMHTACLRTCGCRGAVLSSAWRLKRRIWHRSAPLSGSALFWYLLEEQRLTAGRTAQQGVALLRGCHNRRRPLPAVSCIFRTQRTCGLIQR